MIRYKIINLKNFKISYLLIINLLYQIEYENFHENEILNENILEDSKNLLESKSLLKDFEDILKELDSKVILEKPKIHKEFSNEVYTDLMVLVI